MILELFRKSGVFFVCLFVFSSPGHRPCELLSWVSVRPSVSFSHLNLLLWNHWTDFNQACQKCSLDGPLPDLCFWCWFEIQHECVLIGWNLKNLLVRNHQVNWIVTLQEWSLGGPVLKLWIVCRSEIQDGRHDST